MSVIHEHVMAPKTGHAVSVKRGQHLRITDLEGKQVVDVAIFNADNYLEKLSPRHIAKTEERVSATLMSLPICSITSRNTAVQQPWVLISMQDSTQS